MKRLFLFLFLLWASPAWADTYYVTTGGSGSACTVGSPCATIAAALAVASAGDTVQVGAGTFYERVAVPTSGTMGSPITIQGTRGSLGEWNTIIDGSTALTGWTLATNNGLSASADKNTYRVTEPGSEPCHMNADGADIWHINYDITDGGGTDYLNGRTGFQILALASNNALWDGVEALFSNQGGYTYVRFRNGDNPNSKTIRVAPYGVNCDENNPSTGVFTLTGRNYITISDFEIRGSLAGILITGASTGNDVDNNKVLTSGYQVQLANGPVSTTVQNNLFYGNAIGLSSGRGQASSYYYPPLSAPRVISYNIYNTDKYVVNRNQSANSVGVGAYLTTGTVVTGNTFQDLSNATSFYQGSGATTISSNNIHNIFGSCVYWQAMGSGALTIASNLLYECGNIPFRTNELETASASHELYLYKNRVYNPTENGGLGVWLQISSNGSTARNNAMYVYHNTVIGGVHGFLREQGGTSANLPNMLFMNNLIQLTSTGGSVYFDGGTGSTFCSNAAGLETWGYNWSYGSEDSCAWVGANNIAAAAKIFTDTVLPTNWLPTGAPLGAAIHCNGSFTIDGVMHSALPGCPTADFDIGAVQTNDATPPPADTWISEDTFNTGTSVGADIDGRSGGTSWTSNWQKDPYNEYGTDGTFTVEVGPSGMTSNAIRSRSTNPANYYRSLTPISAGHFQFLFQATATNPNDEILFATFGPTVATWLGGIRADTDGHMKLITTAEAEVEIGPYSAFTTHCMEYQFDSVGQPNKARARMDGGAWTAWTDTYSPFYTVGNISIQDRTTNAMDVYFDDISPTITCTSPGGTITMTSPAADTQYHRPNAQTITISWNTALAGTCNIDYSLDNGVFFHSLTSLTCTTGTYEWNAAVPTTQNLVIRVSQSTISDSRTVRMSGAYLR